MGNNHLVGRSNYAGYYQHIVSLFNYVGFNSQQLPYQDYATLRHDFLLFVAVNFRVVLALNIMVDRGAGMVAAVVQMVFWLMITMVVIYSVIMDDTHIYICICKYMLRLYFYGLC